MNSIALPAIASQLEPSFNFALEERLSQPVLALPRGMPCALPEHIRLLVAAPIDTVTAPPPGWPFGLQWIQLVTSGIDKHPDWFLRSLPTSTARGTAAETIAEYVLAAILEDAKSFSELRVVNATQWKSRPTRAVRGSTVGLIGLGAIGEAVAVKALALGAQVVALRRSARPAGVAGVELVSDLHQVLVRADHLVLAAPATPDTTRMLDAAALAAAKPGMHLINVARGELIDDNALLQALDSGRIRRATLDVTAPEPLPAGHAFYLHPGIWLTPHSAAMGRASRMALVEKTAVNHERWNRGLPLLDTIQA